MLDCDSLFLSIQIFFRLMYRYGYIVFYQSIHPSIHSSIKLLVFASVCLSAFFLLFVPSIYIGVHVLPMMKSDKKGRSF
ncbi:hypothetical protein EDC96DRAFT_516693 [Choanephora cucurbitarum]|nr:hypothetical protein EDC96DRAFT_516693 [Choanephora cucurbitarum]